MVRAKVVLRGARTYTLGGKRWIKDVPGIVNGDAVKQFQENGYFYVAVLKSKDAKKTKKSKSDAEPQANKKKKKKLKK